MVVVGGVNGVDVHATSNAVRLAGGSKILHSHAVAETQAADVRH